MWNAIDQQSEYLPGFEITQDQLNSNTVLEISKQVTEPLFSDLIRFGYQFPEFQEVFAVGSGVSHALGFLLNRQPRDQNYCIRLGHWNEDTTFRVDSAVRKHFCNYPLAKVKQGGAFLKYKIRDVELLITSFSGAPTPDNWASHNALQILFTKVFMSVHAYLRKSVYTLPGLSVNTILKMNMENESLLNYPWMHSIPDFYLLFLLDRHRGIKFINYRIEDIEKVSCYHFYRSYEKFPSSFQRKIQSFIYKNFLSDVEGAFNFLMKLKQCFNDSNLPSSCKSVL